MWFGSLGDHSASPQWSGLQWLAYCRLTICGLGGLLEPLGGKGVGLGGQFKGGLGGPFEFGLSGL